MIAQSCQWHRKNHDLTEMFMVFIFKILNTLEKLLKVFHSILARNNQNGPFPITEFGSNMLQQIYILSLSRWVPVRFPYHFTGDFEPNSGNHKPFWIP